MINGEKNLIIAFLLTTILATAVFFQIGWEEGILFIKTDKNIEKILKNHQLDPILTLQEESNLCSGNTHIYGSWIEKNPSAQSITIPCCSWDEDASSTSANQVGIICHYLSLFSYLQIICNYL